MLKCTLRKVPDQGKSQESHNRTYSIYLSVHQQRTKVKSPEPPQNKPEIPLKKELMFIKHVIKQYF